MHRNTLNKFKNFFQGEPEAFKQLLIDLISRLQPDEPSIDSYKHVINAWNQQNIDPLLAKLYLVCYFRDNFNDVETMVLCDAEEEPEFVHRAIEHLGYRIDPIRAQHIILQAYPKLFIDVGQTARFWEEINKTSMIAELDPDEQEVIKNPALSKLKLLEQGVINQLQRMVLEQIQSPYLPITSEPFSLKEIGRLDVVLPSLVGGFKFYGKYLKNYLEGYLQRYQSDHALRAVVDSEIKHVLNIFIQACAEENLASAIRAVQSIAEIMLLDLSYNPLPSQLSEIIQAQLTDFPVQGTLIVPYGMRAFVRVFQILDVQYGSEHFNKPLNIFVTSQSYYEWLGNLESLNRDEVSVFQTQQTTDVASSADIIFVELHPHNVLASKQFAFNIEALLSQMNSWPSKQRTLVIDMTLNAMNDHEIRSFLHSESTLALIRSGTLNIILIQSLTKFAQLGLDKRSAGALTMINNNDYWSGVNAKLVQLSDVEPIDIATLNFFSYFASLHWPVVEYLELINSNVRFVYKEIVKQTNKLELLHSGLQVSKSSDPKPCYVAINTNGFVTDLSLTSDDLREFVSDLLVYLFYPLCRFYNLPITERYSIGFPLTSINPVFGSLRLTIGLEPIAQLSQYAEILAYITFAFNDLRDERKLPLVQNADLRREFIAEKVKIFKAMTPGRGGEHEWKFEGTGWENSYTDHTDSENIQTRQLKRHVILKYGNIKFFREAPSLFRPHHPEWTELSPRVIVRGIGEISVNDPRITAAEKRIIAGCYTPEYNFCVEPFRGTVSIQNYEVLGPWNAKFLYGPFFHNEAKLFCILHQKSMDFYYNLQKFNEKNVIVKQGTIETALSDMAVEDRAFLIREAYYPTMDRSIPSVSGRNKFDFHMQFIPPKNTLTMQFSLKGNQLIIEHDFLCCAVPGASIYYRVLGDHLTCYEIDYWDEKDPVVARFLRLVTAVYVKDTSSLGISFKARNAQFTHFIFNLNYEVGNSLLQEALNVITFSKNSIKKFLQSVALDEQQYHFYDIHSLSSRQVSWPSGHSPSGTDYISNAAFIKKMLEQFDKFKIFKTYKVKREQPVPDILDIEGDGDCVYNSILAGIKRLPAGINTDIILPDNTHIDLNTLDLAQLRSIVANYIEANQGHYFDLIAFQIADNIRHNELAGYPESMRAQMQILANAYNSRQNIQAAEYAIQQFINNGIVGQYINLMRNTYDSGLEVVWGGAVELGIISEILAIQFYVYRRGGEYYHIDNTHIDNVHRIDLDFTGNHYNLVLLPGMTVNTDSAAVENVFYCNSIIYDNPILNDKKTAELFKLAKSHFGMKGIDRLIDIGLKPEEYQEFQGLRKILGDEKAIKLYFSLELADIPIIDLIYAIDKTMNRLMDSAKIEELQEDIATISSTALVTLTNSNHASSSQLSQGSDFFTFVHRVTDAVTSTLNNGLMNMVNSMMNVIMRNNYIKHKLINYVYHEELSAINAVINKPYVQSYAIPAIQLLLQKHPLEWSEKDFKKIKLVVHSDKGGSDEDFRTVNTFQEQVGDKDHIYQNLLSKLLPTIQTALHKTTIGFKSFDTVVDIARLMYEPTFQNAKKVVINSAYLYSMYQGINGVSVVIGGSEALYQTYSGEYMQALNTVATTAGYMALPGLLAYTAIPCLGLAYGIGMAVYTGYSAITNAYSFYLERTSDVESMLRSTMAYKDLTKILSESPLQQIYDFASTARGYEFELNSIALVAEKEALKSKLVEEKREFGQKLYDHIYEPLLEEKYNLLNQVLQGNIAQEEAKILKAKHIKIESDNPSYEHCMEIKDKDVDTNSEHYYCYNYEKKQLDYVLIGDNLLEVIERL